MNQVTHASTRSRRPADAIWRRGRWFLMVAAGLTLAASGRPLPGPRPNAGNVPITASANVRVRALADLTLQALASLETPQQAETGAAFAQRLANTRRFLLRVAWFESVGLQRRQQGGAGPARSLYQIEPIRALAGCRVATRQGWIDELAAACGQPEPAIARACAQLTPAGWPRANLIEECLRTNDLFATTLARICLEPVTAAIAAGADDQAETWAAVWKRAFTTPAQRERQKAGFLRAAASLDALWREGPAFGAGQR